MNQPRKVFTMECQIWVRIQSDFSSERCRNWMVSSSGPSSTNLDASSAGTLDRSQWYHWNQKRIVTKAPFPAGILGEVPHGYDPGGSSLKRYRRVPFFSLVRYYPPDGPFGLVPAVHFKYVFCVKYQTGTTLAGVDFFASSLVVCRTRYRRVPFFRWGER